MRLWILAGITLGSVAQADAATATFLCVADQSTGFKWNGSEWQDARLHSDEKYTVTWNGSRFVFTAAGEPNPEYECESTYLHVVCENKSSRMSFNGETLRFAHYSTLGYTEGWDGDDLTPSVTFGRCTRL